MAQAVGRSGWDFRGSRPLQKGAQRPSAVGWGRPGLKDIESSVGDVGRERGGRHGTGRMMDLAPGEDLLGMQRLEHGRTKGTGQENVTSQARRGCEQQRGVLVLKKGRRTGRQQRDGRGSREGGQEGRRGSSGGRPRAAERSALQRDCLGEAVSGWGLQEPWPGRELLCR